MLFDFQVAQKNACRRWWEQLRGAKEKKNTTTPRNFFIFIKRTNLIRKNADKRSLRSFPLVLTTTESAEKREERKKVTLPPKNLPRAINAIPMSAAWLSCRHPSMMPLQKGCSLFISFSFSLFRRRRWL